MATPVTLTRQYWGDPTSPRRALLIHGLGSSGALMWLTATTLADRGWFVHTVDLRGHGTSPRTVSYRIEDYGTDALHTTPGSGSWDVVLGHSLGGAAALWAAAADQEWTKRLILVDPGVRLAGGSFERIRAGAARIFADPSLETVRAENPHWHPNDQELKALANHQTSRWAVEQTLEQNETTWDVTTQAASVTTPTHIIGADPAVFSIFSGELAEQVLTNPAFTMSVVAGAGHSPHRDLPHAYLDQLLAAIG